MKEPNAICQFCSKQIYRRPSQLVGRKYISCADCVGEIGKITTPIQQVKLYVEYIQRWKSGLENGMSGKTSISSYIRRYLFNKFENKCKCGWNKIHPKTGKIPLEVNHIDGDHTNNKEDNLELLCPNCHSLTPNYRSLNNGRGRPRK